MVDHERIGGPYDSIKQRGSAGCVQAVPAHHPGHACHTPAVASYWYCVTLRHNIAIILGGYCASAASGVGENKVAAAHFCGA
eukprot:scaffold23370_cov52-Prasinocladus_malaysianus.AAC.3